MNTSPPTQAAMLLQRGIAAARAGRAVEAKETLQQVVRRDPHNELAWLWLSGLMATDEQKRNCLEQVLRANPYNVYARAGLTRLQGAPQIEPAETEKRLESVTPGHAPAPAPAVPLKIARLAQPDPSPPPRSKPLETLCPACDQPIASGATMCPHCGIPFKSIEELLGRDASMSPPGSAGRPSAKGY